MTFVRPRFQDSLDLFLGTNSEIVSTEAGLNLLTHGYGIIHKMFTPEPDYSCAHVQLPPQAPVVCCRG